MSHADVPKPAAETANPKHPAYRVTLIGRGLALDYSRSMTMSISVVISAHNAEATLAEQLDALCAQGFRGKWDVVVVDNRSTDATARIARSYSDRLRLRVVPAWEDASVAYARNTGIAASTGDLIVFLDADDIAAPGLLEAYAVFADRFAVMGGRLDVAELNDPVIAAWRYPIAADCLPTAFGRFAYFLGANFAVRRTAFDLIGRFDKTLRFFGEDVDFSIRAQLAGFEIGWVPDAVVHYRHRVSLETLARQQFIYGRGAVVLFKRYRNVATSGSRFVNSLRKAAELIAGMPNLVRGRSGRGRWIMLASSFGGHLVESLRLRVWYFG